MFPGKQGRGLEPWEWVTTLLRASGSAFFAFPGGLSFSIFIASDSLILLVIDNLGIGFGLFVETNFLGVQF